ncbi:MAG: GNAT family N-acetyltransferase [Rubricoccaceae bacterium]
MLLSPPPLLPFTLRDGTRVALRPVVAADARRVAEGFQALSETSRRFRFLAPLSHLSEAQLRYLTDVDHVDHVAWGVLDLDALETPGFGIGRFIRLQDEPHAAEFSLTIIDAAQGRGLGALLLAVLYLLAPTLDVRVLRGLVARDNERMVRWLQRLGAVFSGDGTEAVLDLPVRSDLSRLPANRSARTFAALVRHLRRAARTWEAGRVLPLPPAI